MTRRLPWKRSETTAATSPLASAKRPQRDSPRTAGIKREVPAQSPPTAQSRLSVASRRREISDRDFTRSPSTSPPPEPPKEELMIPGLENDDGWRMVEDEFLAVARRFTTHLHRAEYARLRTLAASQNAEAILGIERPVVVASSSASRPPAEARRRAEERKRAARQRSVVGAHDGGPQTGLRGLLESPRKDRGSIGKGLGRDGMRTRAAAGFGERLARGKAGTARDGEETAEEETADEPDLPPLRLASTPRREAPTPRGGNLRREAASARSRHAATPRSRPKEKEVVEIDDDDDDPFGLSRRKARREKSREQLRNTEPAVRADRDTMPSFL